MFDYNIKDQVLLLNHKTFGLENELKDLEEKIRIGQNRLHGIQRQLRRELLQGEEGFPKISAFRGTCSSIADTNVQIMRSNLKRNYPYSRDQIGKFQWRFTVILVLEKRRLLSLAGSKSRFCSLQRI